MKKKSRIIFFISTLLLIGLYFFPIWNIDLTAPQYPEGIGLRIWINQITGAKEYDLKNLNGLNHYIGMKKIEPESIPELKIMPYIIAGFILFGFITFLLKNRKILALWIVLLISVLGIGLYDYYMWGYDYGHNLNPNAPIKVPGMTYQPPFIGGKQLLNIHAESLPGIGALLVSASIILAIVSFYADRKEKIEKL